MTLDQNITVLLSTVVGGLLAIIGGFFATTLSQRMAEKAEKRKLTHEKTEELYMLAKQMQKWVKSQLLRACVVEEVKLHYKKAPVWMYDKVNTEESCPLEKMEMLVGLYLPILKKTFSSYYSSVFAIQRLDTELQNSHFDRRSLEEYCKTNLETDTTVNIVEELQKTNADKVVQFLVDLAARFEVANDTLQEALEKLAKSNK
jgi:hypothetical protein